MEVITASNFRTDLNKKIKSVLCGEKIQIKTKNGNVILISEKDYKKLSSTETNNHSPLSPKIPGKIVGNLRDADKEYLQNDFVGR